MAVLSNTVYGNGIDLQNLFHCINRLIEHLVRNRAVQPAHNQSAKADYEAADIMVSTACAIGQYNAVSLPLKHQKAMVCMELPNSSYIFDNEGLEPYVPSLL